jgi:toxin-antitoxin system PIN domain toxin
MRSLLDVNVLIALFDSDHVHHATATQWLQLNGANGWASCPITQNGCLRIMSQPGYPNPLSIPELVSRLRQATATEYHHFIADNISLLDSGCINQSMLLNSQQLTDIYLLALAVKNSCCLVTLDRSIPGSAVIQADKDSLIVL